MNNSRWPVRNDMSDPSPRILLVEDHDDTLVVLTRLLRMSGYEVHACGTAKTARELAERGQCDVLVADIGLPDGSGLDLMRDMGRRHGLRGIAMTGHGEHDADTCVAAGFSRHLMKPVAFDDLLAAIESLGPKNRP